ncbi:MAG: InlB B-repeat-containing protein [Acidimicrobiales bacterium]
MVDVTGSSQAQFATSPFADAVLTPSYAVQSTGPAGDQAIPQETMLSLSERARPVIEIGRRLPLLAGRDHDLDDLNDRIRSGESIEIFAQEGFGKTSLLNMLLHDRPELKGYFADGVVSLSGRTVPDGDLLGALFRTFFVAGQAAAFDSAEMMRRLSPIRALIVLDDIDAEDDELQSIIAGLTAPVFLVTSSERRLHDLPSSTVGPLDPVDLITIAEIRLGQTLDEAGRSQVVELAQLLENRPRAWARAIGMIDRVEDLASVTSRLDGVRNPRAETARMTQDQSGPVAVKAMTLLSELDGAAIGQDLLATVLDIEDASPVTAELEERGVGLVVGGAVTVDSDVAALAADRMDSDPMVGEAFSRLLEWSENAEPAQLVDEVAAITELAEWAVDHDRAEEVVELGRRVDLALFRAGRWGAAAALLLLLARASEVCGRDADKAWALHQLGVRELALGDTDAAKPHLRAARSIRQRLGDKTGRALTQHHLKLIGPLAAATVPVVAAILLAVLGATGATIAAVTAVTGSGDSGGGNDDEIASPTTEISTPVGDGVQLSARLDGPTTVVISLAAGKDLLPGELIQVSRTAPDGGEQIVGDSSGQTPVIDRGLDSNSTYRYWARVIGGVEPGPWSDQISVTTEEAIDAEPPLQVSGVTGSFANGVVTLAWQPSGADDLGGYEVLRDGRTLAQTVTNAEFRDSDPAEGETHGYQIVAFDESGNEAPASEAVRVPIPGPRPLPLSKPTNLVAAWDSQVGVTLSWTGKAVAYRVERDGRLVARVAQPLLIDSDVSEGQTVVYEVFATEDGRSSAPATFPFTARSVAQSTPPTPEAPTATDRGSTIRVQWSAIVYNFPVTYQVLRNGQLVGDGIAETSFDETRPADGTHTYTVVAVNGQGLSSDPSAAGQIVLNPATLAIGPETINFGPVDLGTGTSASVTVSNSSTKTLDFGVLDTSGLDGTGFAASTDCETTVPAQSTCTVTVEFSPTAAGSDLGEVATSVHGAITALTGEGIAPRPMDSPLNLTIDGAGSGTVASNPGGLVCSVSCSVDFPSNSSVTLSADADPYSTFAGWSSNSCPGTGPCTVTVEGTGVSIAAVFDELVPVDPTLTVAVTGAGSGNVSTASGPGIDCPGDCSQQWFAGAVVELVASPSAGSIFSRWSGGGCGGTGGCTVTLNDDTNVQAIFDVEPPPQPQFVVTSTQGGNGSGTVSINPSGPVPAGTVVTLTATAGNLSLFTGWSGGGCSDANPTCTVTVVDKNIDVYAQFDATS